MKSYIFIFFLFLFYSSTGQQLGEFNLFSGVGGYELGSQRSASDSNIYFQTNGIINENGQTRCVYYYKQLNDRPYKINGIGFQNLQLFYQSDKLVRIDFVKVYPKT